MQPGLPPPQGLYDPINEHDSCAVGFIVNLKGKRSHQIVRDGITALENMSHRGACGCENNTGDGAGLLIQIPHEFMVSRAEQQGISLSEPGSYGVGAFFSSREPAAERRGQELFQELVAQEGQSFLGWRRIETNSASLGESACAVEPRMWHAFVGRGPRFDNVDRFERKLYVIRKRFEDEIRKAGLDDHKYFYFSSLSCRTLVYKGMLTSAQLGVYFADDLGDPLLSSAMCMVHSRFSTNTFPSWQLAHPYRMISHNGEINTLRGNINWMRAREALFASDLFEPGDLKKLKPIIREGLSDSACLDNAVELLVRSGYSLAHAMMMLIPEAWENNSAMPQVRRDFYRFHSCLMEPWDGPASVAFTDGRAIGAVLDRNGLRPSRYVVTDDDRVIMASEVGALDIAPESIVSKGRLEPGKMFLVDLEQGRIVDDQELKLAVASAKPYGEWLKQTMVSLADLPAAPQVPGPDHDTLLNRQIAFGYTLEDLKYIIGPMGASGEETIGSMGTDTPLAVLSEYAQPLFNYFKQLFAQVTNPPLDAIREELVTSVFTGAGAEGNLLDPGPENCRQIALEMPILDNDELARIKQLTKWRGFTTLTLQMLFPVAERAAGMASALQSLIEQACEAIERGASLIVLSDRGVTAEMAPIPSLLACSGLHHEMVRRGLRACAGLVIECGDAREVHHFALLLGYGAGTINPYLAFETLDDMIRQEMIKGIDHDDAVYRYRKAIKKSVVKVMSKMGISTIHCYRGGQIFEAIGLNEDFVRRYFDKTATRVGGIGINEIAEETLHHHHRAFGNRDARGPLLLDGGQYQWRRDGEVSPVQPRDCVPAPARDGFGQVRDFQEIHQADRRTERTALDPARAVLVPARQDPVGADRGGRRRKRDCQALRHRRDELRLDFGRGS